MKRIYHILHRIVIAALRLWSGPAQWLDSHFWIKTDSLGIGLGAAVGMKLLRAEIGLLDLLKDGRVGCPHEGPDRVAAASMNCPLCLTREVQRLHKTVDYLVARLQASEASQ